MLLRVPFHFLLMLWAWTGIKVILSTFFPTSGCSQMSVLLITSIIYIPSLQTSTSLLDLPRALILPKQNLVSFCCFMLTSQLKRWIKVSLEVKSGALQGLSKCFLSFLLRLLKVTKPKTVCWTMLLLDLHHGTFLQFGVCTFYRFEICTICSLRSMKIGEFCIVGKKTRVLYFHSDACMLKNLQHLKWCGWIWCTVWPLACCLVFCFRLQF